MPGDRAEDSFRLRISGFTPENFPMERLAEYMGALAKLFGNTSSVHFDRIAEGSAVLVSFVDPRDEPKVAKRIDQVRLDAGPLEARNARQKIDDMLFEDGVDAVLERRANNLIIFPGKARVMPLAFDKVLQSDTLDGVLIQIGGRDDSVPVHLSNDDGIIYKCNTTKAKAREMAAHLFGPVLRVHGAANWRREADGAWRLNTMEIEEFTILSDDAPAEVIRRLRSIPGNSWDKVADPYALLAELRNDRDPN